jgi:hypothetical protein
MQSWVEKAREANDSGSGGGSIDRGTRCGQGRLVLRQPRGVRPTNWVDFCEAHATVPTAFAMEGAGDPAARKLWDIERLATYWPDVAIIGALLGLFWREHHFFEEVEFGGDAVQKWQFVRQWSYANDFSHAEWTHHMARLGVNCTSWLVQKICGRNWRAYYVGPFIMAALQVPFVYLLAKRLGGRLGGLLAVLSILYLAMVHRSASQLLPDGYVGTWAIGACYLYARLVEATERNRLRLLVALSVVSFIGYLVKETFFFFYPGMALAIWLVRRNWRDVAVFAGILLLGLMLETAAYATFTQYTTGRLGIIRSGHLAVDEEAVKDMSVGELFVRFDELYNSSKYLLFFAFGAALWHSVLRKDEQPKAAGMVLIGISHVFFLTFLVRKLHPLDTFQGPDPRYMDPMTPFMGVYAGSFMAVAIRELWQRHAPKVGLVERYGPSGEAPVQAVWAVGVVAIFAYMTWSYQRAHPPLDAFKRGREISSLMNRTYERNLPILERSNRAKILTAIYDVYMDDTKLARAGKLPSFDEAEFNHGGASYLIKDRAVYSKNTLSRLLDEGCFVLVKRGPARNKGTRDRRSTIGIESPVGGPPPSCDALLADLTAAAR